MRMVSGAEAIILPYPAKLVVEQLTWLRPAHGIVSPQRDRGVRLEGPPGSPAG